MEIFIERFLLIYNVVAGIGLISSIFIVKKEASDSEGVNNESKVKPEKWKRIVRIVLYVLLLIVVIASLIYTVLNRFMWVIIPVTIFSLLEKTNEVYDSLSVVHDTVNNDKEGQLSKRETDALIVLSSAICMFNIYGVPNKIIQFTMQISNEILSDWMTVIILVLIVTLYCFLIGVMIQFPLIGLVKLLEKVKGSIPVDRLNKAKVKYRRIRTESIKYEFLSIRLIEWTLRHCRRTRILWILLILITPIDILIKIFCISLTFIMTIGTYVYILLKRLRNTFNKIRKWFERMSERKLINIIFRSAFIVSITIVVIVNRYAPFLRIEDTSTGILEFIASAIVIPMIFAWILDYKSSSRSI